MVCVVPATTGNDPNEVLLFHNGVVGLAYDSLMRMDIL
jgi:hypothetical protein